MAIRNNRNCYGEHDSCCRAPQCDIPSSNIYYDGVDMPEAGLQHGAPLNTVLENLAKYVQRSINISGSITVEHFEGISEVRLQDTPAEVLQVSHCGGVLPPDAYKVSGRNILFCKDYCLNANEFASVQVIYRVKADSSYGFRC